MSRKIVITFILILIIIIKRTRFRNQARNKIIWHISDACKATGNLYFLLIKKVFVK